MRSNVDGMPTRTTAPQGSALLRPDEAGAELRLSRSTIYRMISKGDLESVRVGDFGAVRVTRRSINEYIQRRLVKTTAS